MKKKFFDSEDFERKNEYLCVIQNIYSETVKFKIIKYYDIKIHFVFE